MSKNDGCDKSPLNHLLLLKLSVQHVVSDMDTV